MMRGGRACRPSDHFPHRRMSQTSIERLREYLAQLPPQSQALLMREFERALERGEDTVGCDLRARAAAQDRARRRRQDEDAPPRTDDPARLLFRPLEPFLVDGNFPIRPGQIRRASLAPVWQWLARDGATEAVREFEAALARRARPADRQRSSLPCAGCSSPRRRRSSSSPTPAPGDDRQRALSRVGPPNVVEDLLADRVGAAGARSARNAQRQAAGLSAHVRRVRRSPRRSLPSTCLRCRRRNCCRSRCRSSCSG